MWPLWPLIMETAPNPFLHDRPLAETLVDWLQDSERESARERAPAREEAARATGLLSGEIGHELRAYFDRTTRQVQRYLNAPVALFSLIEGGCQTILSAAAPIVVPGELPADTSLCIHVRDSGRDLVIDDLTRSMFFDVAENATGAGVQSYLGTPVFAPSGEPIGSLCAIDMKDRHWEPADLDLLKALAESLTDKIALLVRHQDERSASRVAARAEVAARARDLFRAMLDTVPHVVLMHDGAGNILSASAQTRAILGLEPEDLLGAGWRERLHPEDTAATLSAPREDATSRTVVRLRGDDGEYRRALLQSRIFEGADVSPVYLLTATALNDA